MGGFPGASFVLRGLLFRFWRWHVAMERRLEDLRIPHYESLKGKDSPPFAIFSCIYSRDP